MKGSPCPRRSVNSHLRSRVLLCSSALPWLPCGHCFQSTGGWCTAGVWWSLGSVGVLFMVLPRCCGKEKMGASPSFSFPLLNEWSLVEVFVFKGSCGNFFIEFLRKLRLGLEFLILAGRWVVGRKTGWNFVDCFFEKKMWNCVIFPSSSFHSSMCEYSETSELQPTHTVCAAGLPRDPGQFSWHYIFR